MKLLEEPKGRATAFVNSGNLAFLTGEVDDALASYLQASALDTRTRASSSTRAWR